MLFQPATRGREELLSGTFLDFLRRAHALEQLSADRLLEAWVKADEVRGTLMRELSKYPILLTPVCATPAFPHGARSLETEQGRVDYLDAMRYTQWWNLLGAPAAVVPVSWREGLPVGVQIAGRPWEDERVLAVAAVLDRAFGYRPPPISFGNTPSATAAR